MPFGTIVDGHALLQMLWVSAATGVGVTTAYGVTILAATRSVDLARAGRTGEAALFAVLGVVSFAAVAAAIVFGILIMSD